MSLLISLPCSRKPAALAGLGVGPTANFTPSLPLLPHLLHLLLRRLLLSQFLLSLPFLFMLHFALCLPLLLCFVSPPSPSEVATPLPRHDTFDWSEWHPPSPLAAPGRHHTPHFYMHNNPASAPVPFPSLPFPSPLSETPSPPHPLSLVSSLHISVGPFCRGAGEWQRRPLAVYVSNAHCSETCLVFTDAKAADLNI